MKTAVLMLRPEVRKVSYERTVPTLPEGKANVRLNMCTYCGVRGCIMVDSIGFYPEHRIYYETHCQALYCRTQARLALK